jgi:hypothetical protein
MFGGEFHSPDALPPEKESPISVIGIFVGGYLGPRAGLDNMEK